jgi:hypothetical protein
MEQLVARWAHNPKAVGSSPAPATQKALAFMPGLFLCDNVQNQKSCLRKF